MENATRQIYAVRTVVILEGTNLGTNLVETDVVTHTGVWFRETVHGTGL
jgi:hypothetical protein